MPLGSGTVSLAAADGVLIVLGGTVNADVAGKGALFFHAGALSGHASGVQWDEYTADLTGNLSLQVTTDKLMLNGVLLPPGTYTIAANAASVSGHGTTMAANFSQHASFVLGDASVRLASGTGNLMVDGIPLATDTGLTLAGYSGTLDLSADTAPEVDSVTLNGNAAQVLRITGVPAAVNADQNTPAAFSFDVQTSLADSYTLTAVAPEGWSVTLGPAGQATVRPKPGLLAGTYPVRLSAHSQSNPALLAAAEVMVTVQPSAPGLAFDLQADPSLTVPYFNAQVPTAFRASLQNLSPDADTYDLTFPNPPAGFNILRSVESVGVPAGQMGIVGLYLEPTGQLAPPGTPVSFTVRATSRADGSMFGEETFTFTMPEVRAVQVVSDPAALSTLPDVQVLATVTYRNVGNVPASVSSTLSLPSELSGFGVGGVIELLPGESFDAFVELTPAASTPLNTTWEAVITTGPAAGSTQVSVIEVRTDRAAVEPGESVGGAGDDPKRCPVPHDGDGGVHGSR
jgi:hypothetical protein